ncbi:MAG: hypothetical protein R3F24_05760 [Gammaproteobacteria bacterium]
MISYAEALQRLLAEARASVQVRTQAKTQAGVQAGAQAGVQAEQQPTRVVALADALGLVSAAPVRSRLNVPGFANSALDGYVLRASATATASAATPVTLAVGGLIPAGMAAPDTGQHAAFEIFTGAPVPAGLDTVVPVERVIVEPGSTRIRISEPLRVGQNIRQTGEDFQQDQEILAAGVRLGPHHLMALAACGVDELEVWRVPRVAILTTGSELTMHGATLAPGRIRDANGPICAR